MIHLGNVPASTTIYIPFATYAGSTGASVTCSGLAVTDVEIYKNGSTTQRSSDAGIELLDTDGIDFDGITGLHGFSIDLSANTDASFYAVGSWYWVVVSSITVDGQTVTFLAATFRIGPAESLTGHPKVDVGGLLGTAWLTPAVAGTPDVNLIDGGITGLKLAASSGLKPLYVGAVTSGSATTYVMSGVTAANDDLNGYRLRITSGAMIGQVRMIKDWVSGTNTLELDTAFSTSLSSADTFVIEPAQVNVKHVQDVIASESTTPDVNVVQISGDSTAADNLEAACDGTGYNVGGGSIVAASVTGAVGSVTGNVGGSVGSLATQAKADVNAEVVDVLSTDTYAELGAVPAATSSLKDKIVWLFMTARNKITQTATTQELKADNGSTTVGTATVSDDGTTFTKGKIS